MGAQRGENRFSTYQRQRSEAMTKSIIETVNQLQSMNLVFSNIHSASLCVSKHLNKLDDSSLHRSASTLLKNPNFRICILPLVRKDSPSERGDRDSIIAQIKIKRLEDEISRLTKSLANKLGVIEPPHAAVDLPSDNGETNKLCILITELLKHADFLFEIDHKMHTITKAGKYSTDRFITSSENITPYFNWLKKKESLLLDIGVGCD